MNTNLNECGNKNNGRAMHGLMTNQICAECLSETFDLLVPLRESFLTRLAGKMCKVGKVGGAGSLSGWSSKNVSSQVREQVKLLLLSSAVSLGTTKRWRLDSNQKRTS